MSIWDFLDGQRGQDRTRALNEFLGSNFDYLLGPTGIPDKVRSLNGLLNPIDQIGQAGADTVVAFDGDRPYNERRDAAIRAGIGTLAAAAPLVAGRIAGTGATRAIADTLTGIDMAPANQAARQTLGDFASSESGMFLGPSAMHADLPALARAEGLLNSGVDRTQVLRDTGWFRGVDGKMRFEIDDSNAILREPLQNLFNYGDEGVNVRADVNSGLLHQNLLGGNYRGDVFDPAYDNIGDGFLNSIKRGGDQVDGSYRSSTGDIEIGAPNPQEGKSVLFHELQHAIQENEGFSRGSSPSNELSAIYEARNVRKRELSSLMDQVKSEEGLHGYGAKHPRLTPLQSEYDALLGGSSRSEDAIAARDAYQRVAGEVEARNTSLRSAMSAERRLETPPWVTQDVPDADQIVRFGGAGPSMSQQLNPAQQQAQGILDMLSDGRGADVTDEMMAAADDAYLFNNYDLPMDEASRMGRAAERFDTQPLYHGSASDFQSFDPSQRGSVTKVPSARSADWLTGRHDVAGPYADLAATKPVQDLMDASRNAEIDGNFDLAEKLMSEAEKLEDAGGIGQNVMQVYGPRDVLSFDAGGASYDPTDYPLMDKLATAKDGGYDAVRINDFVDNADWGSGRTASHIGVFEPQNIRSRFARFDPRLAHLRNLSAGVGGFGLLSTMMPQEEQY